MADYSAALYMRLSKEDGQSQSESIISQRKILRAYAEEQGFSIFNEYADDGYSGTSFDRPAFKRMISDIEKGRINLVITKDLSRLGRDYILSGQYTEIYFPQKGVRYIAVNDGYDSEGSYTDIAPFKNVLNEMYARDISRKIRSALISRMKEGAFVGANPPYGYKRDEKDRRHLSVDENSAAVVREIFESASKGVSPKDIAAELNERGIKTPLDYRNNRGERNYSWSASTVLKIIANPVYLGHTAQGKTEKRSFKSKVSIQKKPEDWVVVKNTHSPIIDEETASLAKKMIKSRGCPKTGEFKNAFSGIIFCADCKRAMSAVKSRKKGRRMNLVCGGYKQKGKAFCSNHFIDYDLLFEAVQNEIKNRLTFSQAERDDIVKKAKTELQKYLSPQKSEKDCLEKRRLRLDLLIEKLMESYAQGIVSKERMKILLEKYESEIKTLQNELMKQEQKINCEEPELKILRAMERYINQRELSSSFLFSLIEKIEVCQGEYEETANGRKKRQKIRLYLSFKEK